MAAGRPQFRGVIRAPGGWAIADGTRAARRYAAYARGKPAENPDHQPAGNVRVQTPSAGQQVRLGRRISARHKLVALAGSSARVLSSAGVVNARCGAQLRYRVLVGRDNGKTGTAQPVIAV